MTMQILVVDDDDMVRRYLEECLADNGHTVLTADGAASASALMAEHADLDLLVTDFNLGTALDGADIAKQFHAAHPDSRVLVITGRPDLARVKLHGCDFVGLLSKPFQSADLLMAVDYTASSQGSAGA